MLEIKAIWELVSSILRWGSLLVGGTCLLVTSAAIGQFPEGITAGESVAFCFLAVGFVFAYAFYWLAVTSIGLCVLRWPMELLRLLHHRIPVHAPAYLPTSYKEMWAFPIWLTALLSAAVSLSLFRLELTSALAQGSIVVLQGFLGGLLLLIRRKLRFESSGLTMAEAPARNSDANADLRRATYVLFAFWLLGPMLIGQKQGSFVDAAYRLAQLRKDHVTVHVAAPWNEPLARAGLHPHTSFLGSSYVRFDDITVRMMSMGSRVVIELPAAQGERRYVRIPRASVEVE